MDRVPNANSQTPVNEEMLFSLLSTNTAQDKASIRDILAKAREKKGLAAHEVRSLMDLSDADLIADLFDSAKKVKEEIYGKRLVLFAPLYISNLCSNECVYCAFRVKNRQMHRQALSQDQIASEVKHLIDQGHKRILLVTGESYPHEGFSYVLKSVRTVYSVKTERGEIRRVNVNVAPLSVEEFKQLKEEKIGTYQLFQETYHQETYSRMHLAGKKKDYSWRVTAMDRALQAGIDDVGIGVLFGLFDWRFEILAMLQHIHHLEERFGVGPHTISVPRLEPAFGSDIASHPPHAVSDIDFRKIVAILRLAVPYTGIIMSTRESAKIREETFALGVSQISAGSRTNPGGYSKEEENSGQFFIGDHRSLDEVVRNVIELGYIPSFCTGCYRSGRTGEDFMDLAKPGNIKNFCDPNALSTCLEYLLDYAAEETRNRGEQMICALIDQLPPAQKTVATRLIQKVREGKRDQYC